MKDTIYYLIIVAVLGIWGLVSIASGQTEVGSGKLYNRPRNTVVYRGRALGVVMVIEALVVLGIYVLTATKPARLTYDQSLHYVEISFVVGAVIAIVMCVVNTLMYAAQGGFSDKAPTLKPMSLHDAAHYLHMPEDEVLQMAENGGLESRQVNGQYMFDKDILETFHDMMGTMK